MEKKIRVTISKYIINIIEDDSITFNLSKNYLLNYIFDQFKNERLDEYCKNTDRGVIQFTLNKQNMSIYFDVLRENKIENEADYIRKILYKYSSLTKKNRELIIFKEKINKLNTAIADKLVCKVTFQDKRTTTVLPLYIGSSTLSIFNYLFCFDIEKNEYKNYKLSNIDIIYITSIETPNIDSVFVEKIIKNFDPFLSEGKVIKAKLTEKGEKIYYSLEINRPNIIEKKDDIYIFKCSLEQAKRYFTYFLDEIEVLEPLELREWFIDKFTKALEKYKRKL